MTPATKLRAWMGASDGMFMMECVVLWALMAAHITIFLWHTTRVKSVKPGVYSSLERGQAGL
ncbi:hypothetical protein BDV33DRAFT_211034 [Aspergillus novoparasiticus]|uniref:Uncharacterized protein n=1 Tax=Aspergillus novoparasiticus TaxID=986946 RepID=A0A5N6E7B8_9EURO|nr:hypothetical protein BDV33DRAFT_211034 [Aspergillus novoparasiticus]